jgi:ABC-2 type transport system ATP-binding protein
MDAALSLVNVVKSFGATRAVDNLDLAIARGSTCGMIGPSGAGKTTAIRLIMSILFPDSGQVEVLGHKSALEAKDRIGYLPEERGVYRRMRVDAFLLYIAQLKGVAAAEGGKRGTLLLERLGLKDVGARKCEDLSKGMLQRVQFVASIINQPELIILDEPFSGLDPVSVRLLKELISDERKRGATILFSTHVMTQAEELCDRVVMIYKGRKVLDEPTSTLRRQYDRSRILFEPLDPAANVELLRSLPAVSSMRVASEGCDITLNSGADPAAAMRDIAVTIAPARLELARIRLEDIFVRLVAGDQPEADSAQALRTHLQGLGGEGGSI